MTNLTASFRSCISSEREVPVDQPPSDVLFRLDNALVARFGSPACVVPLSIYGNARRRRVVGDDEIIDAFRRTRLRLWFEMT
ncbi:hypothetical protein EVAR_71422_1 [Eumeta japonica]|uniref:Uncharacterized protein n=1 Tax=Eumeta variegata TaxID=151549 RepID=A0A4C2A9W5_EUMVA|nr:hypothetical protein EVAR_71422_1 [Eumeta japonica]